ncbi:DUF6228 family protein [Streptomyces sp. NPDC001893]
MTTWFCTYDEDEGPWLYSEAADEGWTTPQVEVRSSVLAVPDGDAVGPGSWPDAPGGWTVSVTTWLEAGEQMASLAADVRHFLTSKQPG